MGRFDYLIIGGGMTADAAARGIRREDAKGTIGIVGAEAHPPYNRPPLTKGLWKDEPLDGIWRKTQEVDAELITALKKNKVTAVGTISRERSLFAYASGPEWLDDPFFTKSTTPEVIRELKSGAFRKNQASDPAALDLHRRAFDMDVRNLKRLADAGVRIGFGADSGQPGRFPGFFEHWEMELMVQAGLTPMQVIQSFSRNAAEALGVTSLGTIEPGKAADLIVLDRDPLKDIRNTRAIHAVYLGGRKLQ